MKAIILVTSIFYIIGLKLGNKIELTEKSNPAQKVITNKIITKENGSTFKFPAAAEVSKPDSIKITKSEDELLIKNKK